MEQALHIFLKDVQRLRIQIVLLMLATGYFAWMDINESAFENGNANTMVQFIVGVMVWFLIARTVHEESVPGQNHFWLTRPYERSSLLGAKLLMSLCIVAVPLFVADCVVLSGHSFGVISNLGGLLLKQLVTASWLILPPLAIASVTRSITEDVLVWLVTFATVTLGYFPRNGGLNELQTAKECEIGLTLLLLVVALWHQYFRRGTLISRALVAAAVLLPVLPVPESAAMALAQFQNDPSSSKVLLTAIPRETGARDPMVVYNGPFHCAPIQVSVQGVSKGWRIEVLSQNDVFDSGDTTRGTNWRRIGVGWGHFNNAATEGLLNACLSPEEFAGLGSGPLTVHTSVVLGIYADDAVKSVRAQWEPFDVPNVGRCEFQRYFRSENYVLTCASPVKYPPAGSIGLEGDKFGRSQISNYRPSFALMDLLTGMSPVYKWATMAMDAQIRGAVADGSRITFKPESRVAVIERDVTVKDVRLE